MVVPGKLCPNLETSRAVQGAQINHRYQISRTGRTHALLPSFILAHYCSIIFYTVAPAFPPMLDF